MPTGPRGNVLLNDVAALEQVLVRDDEVWKAWLTATYEEGESRGAVVDALWKRVVDRAALEHDDEDLE